MSVHQVVLTAAYTGPDDSRGVDIAGDGPVGNHIEALSHTQAIQRLDLSPYKDPHRRTRGSWIHVRHMKNTHARPHESHLPFSLPQLVRPLDTIEYCGSKSLFQ